MTSPVHSKVASHASNFTNPEGPPPSAHLEKLIDTNPDKIYQKGVSTTCLNAWRDQFYQNFDKKIAAQGFSFDRVWAINMNFFDTDLLGKKRSEASCTEYFTQVFSVLHDPRFWRDPIAMQSMLIQLFRLHHSTAFPLNDPAEKVFLHLMHCLVNRLATTSSGLQKRDHFHLGMQMTSDSNDDLNEIFLHKRLFCIKTTGGWRVGAFDKFPGHSLYPVKFDLNGTKMLILDENDNPILRPCKLVVSSLRAFNSISDPNSPFKVDIFLYNGADSFRKGNKNALTFTFDINRTSNPMTMGDCTQTVYWPPDSLDSVSGIQLGLIQKEAKALFETFQMELSQVGSYSQPVIFELCPPVSEADKRTLLLTLFSEFQKDPAGNKDLIHEVADLLCIGFSEEEVMSLVAKKQATASETGYTVEPKAVLDKMISSTLNPSAKEKVPPVQTKMEPPSSVETETVENKKSQEQIRLEKVVEKERRRAAFVSEQKRQTRQLPEENTAADASMLGFSGRDQAQVEDIYKGNPMKAKRFAKFAMGLLKKKVAAYGGSVKEKTKGSHPKLHFKSHDERLDETSRSGGVTFRIHHGHGGDDHEDAFVQRDTLRRILAI